MADEEANNNKREDENKLLSNFFGRPVVYQPPAPGLATPQELNGGLTATESSANHQKTKKRFESLGSFVGSIAGSIAGGRPREYDHQPNNNQQQQQQQHTNNNKEPSSSMKNIRLEFQMKKASELMRQVSGLGMEDPVYGKSSGGGDGEMGMKKIKKPPWAIFDDMSINDIAPDMRDLVSVCSDPTASVTERFPLNNYHPNDEQQQPLGYLNEVVVSMTGDGDDDDLPPLDDASIMDDDFSRRGSTIVDISQRSGGARGLSSILDIIRPPPQPNDHRRTKGLGGGGVQKYLHSATEGSKLSNRFRNYQDDPRGPSLPTRSKSENTSISRRSGYSTAEASFVDQLLRGSGGSDGNDDNNDDDDKEGGDNRKDAFNHQSFSEKSTSDFIREALLNVSVDHARSHDVTADPSNQLSKNQQYKDIQEKQDYLNQQKYSNDLEMEIDDLLHGDDYNDDYNNDRSTAGKVSAGGGGGSGHRSRKSTSGSAAAARRARSRSRTGRKSFINSGNVKMSKSFSELNHQHNSEDFTEESQPEKPPRRLRSFPAKSRSKSMPSKKKNRSTDNARKLSPKTRAKQIESTTLMKNTARLLQETGTLGKADEALILQALDRSMEKLCSGDLIDQEDDHNNNNNNNKNGSVVPRTLSGAQAQRGRNSSPKRSRSGSSRRVRKTASGREALEILHRSFHKADTIQQQKKSSARRTESFHSAAQAMNQFPERGGQQVRGVRNSSHGLAPPTSKRDKSYMRSKGQKVRENASDGTEAVKTPTRRHQQASSSHSHRRRVRGALSHSGIRKASLHQPAEEEANNDNRRRPRGAAAGRRSSADMPKASLNQPAEEEANNDNRRRQGGTGAAARRRSSALATAASAETSMFID